MVVVLLSLPACRTSTVAPTTPARTVADWFVDKHYVESNQRQALEVTDGPARAAVERELGLLRGYRESDTPPAAAHQRVYWKHVGSSAEGPAAAEERYRLTIDAGALTLHKHVVITLTEGGGAWRVVGFVERDLEPGEE